MNYQNNGGVGIIFLPAPPNVYFRFLVDMLPVAKDTVRCPCFRQSLVCDVLTCDGLSAQDKEEVAVGNVQIVVKDCDEEFEEACITSASGAMKSLFKGEKLFYKDVAEQVKKGAPES
jgi:hypothetical protein